MSISYFLDGELGITIRTQGDFFSKSSVNHGRFGALLAFPFGNFSGPLQTGFSQTSQCYLGLVLEGSTLYPISDTIALGPVLWIKYPLANAVSGSQFNATFFDFSLGVQASF